VQRFISEAAYVGFGAGRHRCAGEKFSLASQNDIISHLFANYDVELVGMKDVPKPTWAGVDSSPVPVQRIRVKVTPRKH
jgi:cytochrome P450